jgi:hypothetical protein
MWYRPGFGRDFYTSTPMEGTLFGVDGNALGFLLVLPFVAWAWRNSEREAEQE